MSLFPSFFLSKRVACCLLIWYAGFISIIWNNNLSEVTEHTINYLNNSIIVINSMV